MSLKFVQTPAVALYTGMSASATTARITPYPVDLDGTKLVFSDFGTTPTFTVDPKISGYEEICSFTGMTDNGDGTATLTGVLRDYISKSPYNTNGTGKLHGASAVVVFSDNPQVFNRLAAPENDLTVTGSWQFPTPTIAAHAATKAYADALAIAGAPNALTTLQGLVQLATQAQVDAKTATGSTGASLVSTPDKQRSTLLSDFVAEVGVVATMTIASPAVVTYTSHGLSLNDTVVFTTTGALPTGVTAGTTYYVITAGLTANAFEFSATLGGSAVNTTGSQSGVHSLFRANKYIITTSPATSSWVTGQRYSFKAICANTVSVAASFTPNSTFMAAKTIVKFASTALVAGDITAGMIVDMEYDGTNLQMQNPAGNTVAFNASGQYPAADGSLITGLYNYQAFTSSGTWTKPSGLTGNELVKIQIWGSGGGGGTGSSEQGGGGGGGHMIEANFLASALSATETVTVGAQVAANTGGNNSSFGSHVTAYAGGRGGSTGAGSGAAGGGGGGAFAVGGNSTSSATGATGGAPLGGTAGLVSTFGGAGGGSAGAAGGQSVYGGGGGGAGANTNTGVTGGFSIYGGGGGGGSANVTGGAGGVSIYGGAGGAGGSNGVGQPGVAPGGGGGGGTSTTGGTGARGECRVWVITI